MKIVLLEVSFIFLMMGLGNMKPANFSSDDTALAIRLDNLKRDKRQTTVQYYDFLINEASFKFWTVLELVTCAILLYSTFAAIYYARYVYLNPKEDPDADYEADLFTGREMEGRSYKNDSRLNKLISILDAISKPPQISLNNDFDES